MIVDLNEREGIINETIERLLKILPETIGNLMKAHSSYAEMNSKFYSKHPEFVEYKDIVKEVLRKMEGSNPLRPYGDLLNEAIPEINQQIGMVRGLGNKIPDKSSLKLSITPISTDSDNGAL
jgi:hypothetical protein